MTLATALAAAPGATEAQSGPEDTTRIASADTFALPEIVVTATRVPLPREALPTPVTVWTGEALREEGLRTVAGALSRVPGAAVTRSGSPGAQTSLFLRGGESDYVKVLVDGVPVNDPGGAVDLADLSLHQVERIEVVRGPVSVLYGSDAVAGVVQVFTRRPTATPTVSARLQGGWGAERVGPRSNDPGADGLPAPDPGSYALFDADASVAGAVGSISYSVGGGGSWSQGLYPVNNDRGLRTGTVRVGWTGSGAEVAFTTRYTDSRSYFPTDGAGALVDANARLDRSQWTGAAVVGLRLHPRIRARFQASLARRSQETLDRPDGPADTLGTFASQLSWDLSRRTLDARVDADLPGGTLSAGAAWEEADATTAYTSESPFGPYGAGADYRRTTRGGYLQLLTQPLRGLHLTVGGRLDRSDTYGSFRTYRAGVAWEPVTGTRIRGAVGQGFREPSFDQVFGSGFGDLGNPALDPETSSSWEAGVEQALGPVTASVTWFQQRFRDLIQFTFAPADPADPNYFNVGAAAAAGLEVEARATLGAVDLAAHYTDLRTRVLDPGLATDAGFVEDQPLLRRPRRSGRISARYTLSGGSLGMTLNAVGDREDLDFGAGFPAPRVTLPAYAILDMSADHSLPLPGLDARGLLRVENALNARHQSVAGFPGLGRVVRLGVEVTVR